MKKSRGIACLSLVALLAGCSSEINAADIITSASGEVITGLTATATGRISPFDGVMDDPRDLEDLVTSALGDGSLDLHRGHDEIGNVLEAFLGISHDEMHALMEQENLNLAGVCERFGFDPENLLLTLEDSYTPWVSEAVTKGVVSKTDAEYWGTKISEALRVRVYWRGDPEKLGDSSASDRRTIAQGDTVREYLIHVPDAYQEDDPAPLILNMHGACGDAESYRGVVGEKKGLHLLADQHGFLVAYPQAVIKKDECVVWQPGDTGEEDIALDDVYFIQRLLDDIKSRYNIDGEQIFALGYSNGGMMAFSLGCNSGGAFAAVGGMATTMIPERCNEDHTPSVIAFHGTRDSVLPYEGGQGWQAVPDVVDFWVEHNGLTAQDVIKTEFDGGAVRLDEYLGDHSAVVLYTLEGGGHEWFSQDINGRSPNEILWEFLEDIRL